MKLPTGVRDCAPPWMVGDGAVTSSCWPACGEIDVMEQVGQDPALISGTPHGLSSPTSRRATTTTSSGKGAGITFRDAIAAPGTPTG